MEFVKGGQEYINLILRNNKSRRLRIVDFGRASTGDLNSTAVANATQYLIKPRESIHERMLGVTVLNKT